MNHIIDNIIDSIPESEKTYFEDMYLKHFNDYLSTNRFAEDHGLTRDNAELVLSVGRKLNHQHGETK